MRLFAVVPLLEEETIVLLALGSNLIGKEADELFSEENVTFALPFADLLD
jgi:hypothetical protein